MKTLPNGLTIFNATPHVIRFWREDWPEPIEVEPDETISASVEEEIVVMDKKYTLVSTRFQPTTQGYSIIGRAHAKGALIVGSIIAAQAYPGLVMGLTPTPGYERVPPAEKRMAPDKFTVF
jgi:hypothetical protein